MTPVASVRDRIAAWRKDPRLRWRAYTALAAVLFGILSVFGRQFDLPRWAVSFIWAGDVFAVFGFLYTFV